MNTTINNTSRKLPVGALLASSKEEYIKNFRPDILEAENRVAAFACLKAAEAEHDHSRIQREVERVRSEVQSKLESARKQQEEEEQRRIRREQRPARDAARRARQLANSTNGGDYVSKSERNSEKGNSKKR